MIRNKTIRFLNHTFEMVIKSSSRFFLSLLGLAIGIFIFSTGNIILDSYYMGMLDQVNEMSDMAIVAEISPESDHIITILMELNENTAKEVAMATSKHLIYHKKTSEESSFSVSASVIGVSSITDVIPATYKSRCQIAANVKLLKGRLINENDNALANEVVVIDKFTEQILFPEGESLGNKLTLNIDVEGVADISEDSSEAMTKHELTVIGVIDNLNNSKYAELQHRRALTNLNENIVIDNIVIYCPISTVKQNKEVQANKIFLWSFKNKEEYASAIHKVNVIHGIYQGQSEFFNISTHEQLLKDEISILKPYKTFFNALLIFFLGISGLSTMSIMFFSIKERVPEIGIRKAYGASKLDIILQFILEGMIMAFVAAIIAIFLSFVASIVIQEYIQNTLFINFNLRLSIDKIAVPLFVAGIFGFCFSLIPSLYGAKISITSALRFE